MNLTGASYRGAKIDDEEILQEIPQSLRDLLDEVNGFVVHGGGLHVRGACMNPRWHSLREAMHGENAFHRLYPDTIDATDIPFGQDCSGDQFVLRGGEVHQLASEVGEIDPLDMDLGQFLKSVEANPIDALCMHPLQQFQKGGGNLVPGDLLLAYPPFCTGQSGGSASLKSVDCIDVQRYHADLAKQIREQGNADDFMFQASQ